MTNQTEHTKYKRGGRSGNSKKTPGPLPIPTYILLMCFVLIRLSVFSLLSLYSPLFFIFPFLYQQSLSLTFFILPFSSSSLTSLKWQLWFLYLFFSVKKKGNKKTKKLSMMFDTRKGVSDPWLMLKYTGRNKKNKIKIKIQVQHLFLPS
jgi:hypothetical protein